MSDFNSKSQKTVQNQMYVGFTEPFSLIRTTLLVIFSLFNISAYISLILCKSKNQACKEKHQNRLNRLLQIGFIYIITDLIIQHGAAFIYFWDDVYASELNRFFYNLTSFYTTLKYGMLMIPFIIFMSLYTRFWKYGAIIGIAYWFIFGALLIGIYFWYYRYGRKNKSV